MAKVIIPTLIFRHPIQTDNNYWIEGMLLDYGKKRETPYLSEWETYRLKLLATTKEWRELGGEMLDGLWESGDIDYHLKKKIVPSFIEANYRGHQISLVSVQYDTEETYCRGVWDDILGNSEIGQRIRDWVEQNSEWMDIGDFVSRKVGVRNDVIHVYVINNTIERID